MLNMTDRGNWPVKSIITFHIRAVINSKVVAGWGGGVKLQKKMLSQCSMPIKRKKWGWDRTIGSDAHAYTLICY